MPIHQSYVITSGGVSSYAYTHATDTIVSLGWDLPDATVVEVGILNGQPPQRVSLADLRAWVLQREIDVLAKLTPQPPFLMEAPEVANPDAPVSQWERK